MAKAEKNDVRVSIFNGRVMLSIYDRDGYARSAELTPRRAGRVALDLIAAQRAVERDPHQVALSAFMRLGAAVLARGQAESAEKAKDYWDMDIDPILRQAAEFVAERHRMAREQDEPEEVSSDG